MKKLILATRGSELALTQSKNVARDIEKASGVSVELLVVKTQGDAQLDKPLHEIGGKGLFTAEVDLAVIEGRADFSVHSMKDLPTDTPDELILAAVPTRAPSGDMLATNNPNIHNFSELPKNAIIGCGSLRRQAQIAAARPDIICKDVRGNIATRLEKMKAWDGLVLASAAAFRLNISDVNFIPLESIMLPAPGQGALALMARKDSPDTLEILKQIDDIDTRDQTTAERSFLQTLEAGCHAPAAALATLTETEITLEGAVFSVDGKTEVRNIISAPRADAVKLGHDLALYILNNGGKELLG